MTISPPILSRLDTGRPLLVGGDPAASLRSRGITLQGPAALGRLVREDPAAVREHYHHEINAGVDVLCCLTADTIPRALQQIGMPFRAAALTGCAVDLALDAAEITPRPILVAGVLGTNDAAPLAEDRLAEELGTHAARLATAGCELILARGVGAPRPSYEHPDIDPRGARVARRAAIVSGAATELPTWTMLSLDYGGFTIDGEAADECARHAFGQGAQVIIFEVPTVEVALGWLDRVASAGGVRIGFAPAAGSLEPEAWALQAKGLLDAGVRVIGGGAGTTYRHIGALSALLRGNGRQSLWPRAV